MNQSSHHKSLFFFSVFLSAVSVLLFEMAQIRMFSYSLPPVLAYSGISLAMTGFGIGAMTLSVFPGLRGGRTNRTLSILAIAQAASMIVSCYIFAKLSWVAVLSMKSGLLALIFGIIVPCTLPFFFAGLFVAVVFMSMTKQIGKVYFYNLFGSGIGAILITLLLTALGTPKVICIASILSSIAAFFLAWPLERTAIRIAGIMLVAGIALFPFAGSLLSFLPDPMDVAGISMREASDDVENENYIHEFDVWNIVAKIDIWKYGNRPIRAPEKIDYRSLTVDSGASTVLIGGPNLDKWGNGLFEDTSYGLAYRAKPSPDDVLVIGTGGGIDVQSALHHNAKRITAVEINSTTIDALQGPYADFVKWPKSEKVEIVHADGRAFVKAPEKKYDVIQMSGVDTLTVYATGAFNMVEESLYTVDAFEDYLSALKPDGVLSIIRFGMEHFTLARIAVEALRLHGIKDPRNHIAIFRQHKTVSILVSKTPFSKSQIDSMEMAERKEIHNSISIPIYERFGLEIRQPVHAVYLPGRRGISKSEKFFKEGANVQVGSHMLPSDDNPFFMLSRWLTAGQVQTPIKNNVMLLKRFWMATVILALLLTVFPVVILRRKISSGRPLKWLLPYFFLVGASFMMLEIGIINRFSIFIGSPGASIAVVLTSILIFSGAGSYVSELKEMLPHRKILYATIGLVLFSVAIRFATDPVFSFCWGMGLGQVVRGIVAGILIAPIGFCMGWFFPTGLKAVNLYYDDKHLLPWAVSINGFASVLGSVVALPFTIFYGYNNLFIVAMSGYILAGLLTFSVFKNRKI